MSARVAVLGGGISGLAAAHRVRELSSAQSVPIEITVVEREGTGCIETRRERGFLMEMGAESLPRQKPHALALIERLGLGDQLLPTQQDTKGTLIAHGNRLRRLPQDFSFFTPGSLASLFASGLFGARGTLRAALEPLVPRRRADGDESVASFVTRRMGSAVLERLAQPLVGGIYSGDPQRLSMQATLPNFLEIERNHGSLLRGMTTMQRAASAGLLTLRDGMDTLTGTLARKLETQTFLHATATTIASADGTRGWEVTISDGRRIHADAVICALPAFEAGTLLGALDPRLSVALEQIRYNSIAVVTLAFDIIRTALPRVHGVLVPFTQRRNITAITLSSLKYSGRAPEGSVLLRTYLGGALQSDLPNRGDDELVELARSDVREILGIADSPCIAIVRRWMRALPEYEVGHLEKVAEIERRAAALPRFALTGAGYRGVGISDCIASAESAAERIVNVLRV